MWMSTTIKLFSRAATTGGRLVLPPLCACTFMTCIIYSNGEKITRIWTGIIPGRKFVIRHSLAFKHSLSCGAHGEHHFFFHTFSDNNGGKNEEKYAKMLNRAELAYTFGS